MEKEYSMVCVCSDSANLWKMCMCGKEYNERHKRCTDRLYRLFAIDPGYCNPGRDGPFRQPSRIFSQKDCDVAVCFESGGTEGSGGPAPAGWEAHPAGRRPSDPSQRDRGCLCVDPPAQSGLY